MVVYLFLINYTKKKVFNSLNLENENKECASLTPDMIVERFGCTLIHRKCAI